MPKPPNQSDRASQPGSVTRAIKDLAEQDETAAELIWGHFFKRLSQFAKSRIYPRHYRLFDEHDITSEAFFALFDGVRCGRFQQIKNRDELWKLLTVIATRKIVNQANHHDRLKRGGGKFHREANKKNTAWRETTDFNSHQLAKSTDYHQSPSDLDAFADCCDEMLGMLPNESYRKIALLRLAGFTDAEVAEKLGCVPRTVERKLQTIRMVWDEVK